MAQNSKCKHGKYSFFHTFFEYNFFQMSEYIRPQVKTILREPNHPICKSEDKLRLLVLIYSSPQNYEKRRIIRKTWGKAFAKFPGVRLLFLLGQSPLGLESDIETEASKYEDMVQEDFIDTFVNLTLKATFMFKWITANDCLSAKFLFKVDDDTFVNPDELWSSLEHSLLHSATTKSLLPFMKKQALKHDKNYAPSAATLSESIDYLVMGRLTASVPIRDMTHKLYLPTKFYPLNIFPKHLSGSGYVISMSIVPLLYECMLRTPFMNLEDVMLTGLCATTQMGLQLTDNPLFRSKKPPISSDYLCFYKKSAFVHGLSSSEMDDMWIRINEEHNCDTFYFAFVQYLTSFVDIVKNIFRLI